MKRNIRSAQVKNGFLKFFWNKNWVELQYNQLSITRIKLD